MNQVQRSFGRTLGGAIVLGIGVMFAGTMPRNIFFAANLRWLTHAPWAVPVTAAYLWWLWRYLDGTTGDPSTRAFRRDSLRARSVPARLWVWALLAGGAAIVALVLGLQVLNRFVVLPSQTLPDLSQIPRLTTWSLLLAAAPIAGFVEEASFRGYMQTPIEREFGLAAVIVITGTMFALVHLDFTWILWPYYLTVAAIYSSVTRLTNSVWPSIVLHTGGNLYSNIDLLLHGRAEWQARQHAVASFRTFGFDPSLVTLSWELALALAVTAWSFRGLARAGLADRNVDASGPHPAGRGKIVV